ncbi:MAG: hypothetical protein JNM10_02755 [Planctomycetia bacterium]|nr:hypothetical protein [Planctomycetia bacterium]
MTAARRAAGAVVGAAIVAALVRGAWAFGASVAADLGMESPLRIALLPIALVAAGAGVAAWRRRARADRWGPLAVAFAGAIAGLALARPTTGEGVIAGAAFLLVAAFVAVSHLGPDDPAGDRRAGDALPRGPAPLPDDDPPLLG